MTNSITIPDLVAASDLRKTFKGIAKKATTLTNLIQAAAIQCILHGMEHSDFTLARDLTQVLANGGVRQKGLIAWFEFFGGMRWDTRTNEMKKNRDPDTEADIQGAINQRWSTFTQEAAPVVFDLAGCNKRCDNLLKIAADLTDGEYETFLERMITESNNRLIRLRPAPVAEAA